MENSKEYQKEVAETIIQQIKNLDPLALPAYGARDFKFFDLGLCFKVSGKKFKGRIFIHYVRKLDLYKIEFIKEKKIPHTTGLINPVTGKELKYYTTETETVKTYEMVYDDMLIEFLDYCEKGERK